MVQFVLVFAESTEVDKYGTLYGNMLVTQDSEDKTPIRHRSLRPEMPRNALRDGVIPFSEAITHHQFVQFSEALRDSEAFRSSLITADRASGLIPCSQSLTQMDKDSMSKPVFSSLEISRRTSIVSRTAFRFAFDALAMLLNGKLAC